MMTSWRKRMLGNQRGFTLVELMIVVAIIGILTAIAFPLYTGIQARARTAKAQADIRTLASAVVVYSAHTGAMPAALTDLQSPVTAGGVTAGPFIPAPGPTPPQGWSAYTYTQGSGTFSISSSGDGTTVSVP